MAKILVIDDEKSIRNTLRDVLEYEKHIVEEAEDGLEGLSKIKSTDYDLIFCDIKMPKADGIDVLDMGIESKPDICMVMISGHGNIETAVNCLKKGAFDYIEKPIDLNRLLTTVRNALDRHELVIETKKLRRKIQKNASTKIIGESEGIEQVKSMISKVAPTDARVLITGGNGSGKELVARQIHEMSKRNKMPFIEVNCAAIPSELIESELFGHEKGAFTSAIKLRKGKFEQADGGTLFLDEIGDMSPSAQAKVLRALQENKITRVGGDKEIKVNVRIISATNKDLLKNIKENHFREDLYHRLSVIVIKVPPLNKRKSDIPILSKYFLKDLSDHFGTKEKEIEQSALEELQKIDWTGNIRELRNVIERLIILSEEKITLNDIKQYAKK